MKRGMPADRAGGYRAESQLSGAFLAALVAYLERAGGFEMAAEALGRAGCNCSPTEVKGLRWVDAAELLRIATAAAELTGDADIGRRTGEEMYRLSVADPTTRAYFVSLGSPREALAGILEHAVKLGRGRTYRVVDGDAGCCVVEGHFEQARIGEPFFCGIALGFWSQVPSLFGTIGTATHPTCQCRADDVCTFVIRWDPGAAASADDTRAASAHVDRRFQAFEEMQAVAAGLARATDLEALAERLLDGLDAIVPAPHLIVAIRSVEGRPQVVASRRMRPEEAEATARRLLKDRFELEPAALASAPLGPFGVMAAIAPDARAPSAMSTRLLAAFAEQATARIEAMLARFTAERTRHTADAMLLLAGALTGATTEQEVSSCLAEGIPALVGADHSCVMRWDAASGEIVPLAHVGPPGRPPFRGFTADRVPHLTALTENPAPLLLRRSRADSYVAEAMESWGEEINIIVPLVDKGELLGLVSAGFEQDVLVDRDAAFARLRGAADLALTAYARARLLDEIRHQALHDDLTGLPNRTLLEARARTSIAEARRTHQGMALLFLDLDRFKNVNDSMGHDFGDTLIQRAAFRIAGCLSSDDFLARMGGDEFVVVLDNVASVSEVEAVAERILAQLRRPLEIDGHSLYVSASIGLAVYPEDGDEYGLLLQTADSSMYAAKRAGRGTIRRRAHAPDAADVQRRLVLETELHRALERDEITVLYQPQVALADLKLQGVEALIRWQHPELGLISPGDFLSVAEECGLLPALDRRVRRLAFAQARQWQEAVGSVMVAVNLAAQTLCRPGLLHEVADDLELSGVDPTAVEVELTEGMVGDDELIPVVEGLASMGFQVAIDDFGTGASVFARLQRLPIHTLKIDRSLVQVGSTRRDTSILGAIIRMSHSLGLTVVGEGVETPTQAARLRREGCDSGQGFLFGAPMSAAEIESILYSQAANLGRPAYARSRHPVRR